MTKVTFIPPVTQTTVVEVAPGAIQLTLSAKEAAALIVVLRSIGGKGIRYITDSILTDITGITDSDYNTFKTEKEFVGSKVYVDGSRSNSIYFTENSDLTDYFKQFVKFMRDRIRAGS